MPKVHKFHGLELAGDSPINNMALERLPEDPTGLRVPGKIWYNTTEMAVKYTAVDDLGNLVVRAVPVGTGSGSDFDPTALEQALLAEIQARTDSDDALDSAVSAEVSRASGAESALDSAVSAEVSRASGAESALGSAVSTLSGKVGNLASLQTTAKDSVVAAVNELVAGAGGGGGIPSGDTDPILIAAQVLVARNFGAL
jgi:hypothetical protein